MREKPGFAVIHARSRLSKKAVGGEGPDLDEIMAAADSALEEVAEVGRESLGETVAQLSSQMSALRDGVTVPKSDPESDPQDEILRACNVISGEADTVGFPLLGRIAERICRLLEASAEPGEVALEVLQLQVDALSAAVAGNMIGPITAEGETLLASLDDLVDTRLSA